ncbi:MAG: hypothetical protein M3Z24_04445 [Chloroflexota bacterium]|nr:hypothetical protein [Chloroflexota bacterium]
MTHDTHDTDQDQQNLEPSSADPHTELWNGGTTAWNADGTGSCTMICRDTEEGHDIVALVAAPQLAELFLLAPPLLMCSEVLAELVAEQRARGEPPNQKAMKALAALDWARTMNCPTENKSN